MKLNKVLLGFGLAATTTLVLAAKPAPVIEASTVSTSSSSSSSQLENLTRQLEARNRAQANIQRQLDELQNEVNELRGVTEVHSHQLNQVLQRQRELYQELDRRVSEALKSPQAQSLVAGGSNANTPSYSSDLTENEAYDRAVNLVLKEKKYDQAIPEFRAFNQKFPQSTYSPNAHYWLGQLLFNKGELNEAKVEFETLVNNYPDSSKRGDAILKLAMVEQKQNNNSRAIALYKKLISEYPSSSAAQLAKPRLDNLQ